MRLAVDLSPNYSKVAKKRRQILFVIIHYTGMQSEIVSLKRLRNLKSKVSCHYLINRQGKITQMVKEHNIAWHAGKSRWLNFKNLNSNSIGIELVNRGHDHGYQKYSGQQIKSLIYLCKKLKKKYRITQSNFLGHSDIAPLRKVDPGEKFPWRKLSLNGLGNWYKLKKLKSNTQKLKNIKFLFFKNLYFIGYRYISKDYKKQKNELLIVKAFQRRYQPANITGKIDQKSLKISQYLAEITKK